LASSIPEDRILSLWSPGIEKAKEGLFQSFKEPFEEEGELAFLVREEQGGTGDLDRRRGFAQAGQGINKIQSPKFKA